MTEDTREVANLVGHISQLFRDHDAACSDAFLACVIMISLMRRDGMLDDAPVVIQAAVSEFIERLDIHMDDRRPPESVN